MTADFNLHQSVLDDLYDGVYFVDRDKKIAYWNRAAEQMTGFAAAEVEGQSCSQNILVHVDDQGTKLCLEGCPLTQTLKDGKHREAEVFLHHKQGHRLPVQIRITPVRDEAGTICGAVEIFSDASQVLASKELIAELKQAALLDHLTQLPNRRFVEEQLTIRMEEMNRFGWPFGVLIIDIDHFKKVNDTYGHNMGDEVLRMVAQTLESTSRPFDIIGRWGGEEFIAVVRNVDQGGLDAAAERYRLMIQESVIYGGPEPIRVTVSIGGSLARTEDALEAMVDRADANLYRCKEDGRNRSWCRL